MIPPPIFFSVLPKRKRAVDGPKEKNAWRGTCAQGASSLKYGSCSSELPPILHSPTGARRSRSSNHLPPRLHPGGHRWWSSKSPSSWPRCRYPGKEKNKVSGTSRPPPAPRRGQRLSWNPTDNPPRNIFSFPPCTAHFLFDVSKRKWGVHSAGKAGVVPRPAPVARKNVPAPRRREKPPRWVSAPRRRPLLTKVRIRTIIRTLRLI